MTKRALALSLVGSSFLLSLSLCAISVSAEEEEGEISTFVEKGMAAYSKGDVDRALVEFNEALKVNPNDPVAYFQRAKAYEQKKRLDQAISDYSQVIKKCPGFFLCEEALYARGVLYHKKDRLQEANGDYTTLIQSSCSNKGVLANTHNNRALIYDQDGKYDLALADFNKALDLSPELINLHFNRGITYTNMGIYPLALQDFEKELDLNPRCVSAARYKSALLSYGRRDYKRCWFELFSLLQSGETVSRTLMDDLKKKMQSSRIRSKTYSSERK
jgi:tetratricopeptide (TPR) repeat protein